MSNDIRSKADRHSPRPACLTALVLALLGGAWLLPNSVFAADTYFFSATPLPGPSGSGTLSYLTSTAPAGLARYTCPGQGIFLNPTCREALFPNCSEQDPPLAVTTDRFVSLSVDIEDALDGDVWQWFWHRPDGAVHGPATTVFHESFNGENNCFVFQVPLLGGVAICGTRSVRAEWGHGGVHNDAQAGLWQIELKFNEHSLFQEPFELFFAPYSRLTGFSVGEDFASNGALGLELDLRAAPNDAGTWKTTTKIGLAPSSLSQGQISGDIHLGLNSIRIELPQHQVARFNADTILTIQTETATQDEGYLSDGGLCLPSIPLQSTLAIPLPVVFIHGLIPPDNLTKGRLSKILKGPFVERVQVEGQKSGLFTFLEDSTNNITGIFNTSNFRIPYASSTDPDFGSIYPTLYLGDWISVSYDAPEVVAAQLEAVIDTAISRTYSERVNIVGHSAGGVLGRYLVQRAVGRKDLKIAQLILVGSPNRGTSYAYLASDDLDVDVLAALANGVGGLFVPSGLDNRGPYWWGDMCQPIIPPPLKRTYDDSITIPAEIVITNLVGVGHATPYDIVGSLDQVRYRFRERILSQAKKCSPINWEGLRDGDGVVSVGDAWIGRGDIMVPLSVPGLRKLAPHIFLLEDQGIRREILRALNVRR